MVSSVPGTAGLGSASLLQGAQVAAMTHAQRIRGVDRGVDSALIVTSYESGAVAGCAACLGAPGELPGHGARELRGALYTTGYTLAHTEIGH